MAKKRIIDKRKKEKFMMDDDYLNGQAKLCGIYATGVYMSLCRHSSKDQEAFPSIDLMAEELAIDRKSVIKGISSLEKHRVIEIEKKRTKTGKWQNNVYILLDKSEWSKYNIQVPVEDMGSTNSQVLPVPQPSPSCPMSQVPVEDCKETHLEGNTFKETHLARGNKKLTPIQQVVEKFFLLKGWEKQGRPIFSQFVRPAKDLLELCEGDLSLAFEKMELVYRWADAKGLEWSIGTIFKKWNDLNYLEQDIAKSKRAFIGQDKAYQKNGDWYVILSNGEHKKWIGSLDEIRYA